MLTNQQTASLPTAMEGKLRSIRRRQMVIALVRGLGVGASVLIAAMILAMAIDWAVTLFDVRLRTMLTLGCLALSAAALLVVSPPALLQARQWGHAASEADGVVPQLQERWTTVASFARSPHQPRTPAARAMLQQVTHEASAMQQLVEPDRVAPPAALKPVGLALAASLLGLIGFLALNWPQTSILLARFWSPQTDITATQLTSPSGDQTIPRGEMLELTSTLSGMPRAFATLQLRHSPEVTDTLELIPAADDPSLFMHSLRAEASFEYRLRAGDGQTPWHTVTVVDYPALDEVHLTITPPDYIGRPPLEKRLIPGRIKVVQGSRLELRMTPAGELERMELELSFEQEEGDPITSTIALAADADGWYRYQTELTEDMTLRPRLWNRHGLTNDRGAKCRIQVIADKAPVARIVSPSDQMAVAVDDVIDIEFEAHDDFGIGAAELVVYDESTRTEGKPPEILSTQPIPLGDQQWQKHVMTGTQLDLKELGLAEGTQISYAVRVTDNRRVPADLQTALAQASGTQSAGESTEHARAENKDAPTGAPGEDDVGDARARADASETADTRAGLSSDADEDSAVARATGRQSERSDSEPRRAEAGTPGEAGKEAGEADEPGEAGDSTDTGEQLADADADTAPQESSPEMSPEDLPAGGNSPAAGDSPENAVAATDKPEGPTGDESAGETGDQTGDPGETDNSDDQPAAESSLAQATDADSTSNAEGSGTIEAGDDPPADGETSRTDRTPADPADDGPMPDDPNSDPPQVARLDGEPLSVEEDGETASASAMSEQAPPPPVTVIGQQSESGQNTETTRRTLRITARLAAVAEASENRKAESLQLRDRILQVDERLEAVEQGLTGVIDRRIRDADHNEQYRRADEQLGEIASSIAAIREQTRDGGYAFVGLQLVDIGRTHITPAQDRVFAAIRDVRAARRSATDALQHVVRARELLDALLRRYDRVARDRQFAEALDEAAEMYEVYVEKRHRLMREARQNRNPLERRLAVIEVDQEYLDRYAEVLQLRREMLAEFARMLADDPRLMSRYLDQLKRRRDSLRDQLGELSERQYDQATELSGWLAVSEQQRENLWQLIAGMRLQATGELAGEAAELAERIDKQLPLVLEATAPDVADVLHHAGRIARTSRDISFAARRLLQDDSGARDEESLADAADRLMHRFSQLDAALDRLNFAHEEDEEVTAYVTARLLESRTVADRADAWAQLARGIERQRYAPLARVDQQQTAIATELLRVEMLGFESDLQQQFERIAETDVPGEIVDLIRNLHRVMERITWDQAAAMFAISREALETAQRRQAAAVAGFDQAEELFDKIRRAVIAHLDQYDPDDPNIADLEDPTLDEFLAQLEREPNIQAQLGIPNRPRNLRIIANVMTSTTPSGDFLGATGGAARRRVRQAMQMKRPPEDLPPAGMTEQERQLRQQQQQMQQQLEKSLAALKEKLEDPDLSEQQRRRLQQMAEGMQQMLRQIDEPGGGARLWQQIVESDQARAILKALAGGRAVPDEQWNKILSTLDDGLWQVRGRTLPEQYRRAIEQYQDHLRRLMDTIEDES